MPSLVPLRLGAGKSAKFPISGRGAMGTSLRIAGLLCASVLIFISGCNRIARSWYLSSYDRDISSATQAIETARDNAHRAAAYAKRGSAYSEKARYSRAFKLISADEYDRLFGLAIKDHDQAIALDPSARGLLQPGATYYDRAVLEAVVDGALVGTDAARKAWFDPAVADFKKAIERDGRHYQAWDMLGLTHETTGELDQAINDYSQEMALNPLGRARLADAYCVRGGYSDQKGRSMMPPSRITRNQSISAPPPTAARAIPTIRCSDSTLRAGDTTRAGKSSTRRRSPGNGSRPNSWIN